MSLRREDLAIAAAVAFGFFFIFPAFRKKSGEAEADSPYRLVKFSPDCESFTVRDRTSDEIIADLLEPIDADPTLAVRTAIASEANKIYGTLRKEGKDFIELTQSVINEMVASDCRFRIIGEKPLTLAQGLLFILISAPLLSAMKRDGLADIYAINKVLEDYAGAFAPVDQEDFTVKQGFLEDNVRGLYQIWKKL